MHIFLLASCLQADDPTGEAEELAEEDPEATAQGLDLSLTKKKKKRKPKARTDEEFGAMVEDTEGVPADGMSLQLSKSCCQCKLCLSVLRLCWMCSTFLHAHGMLDSLQNSNDRLDLPLLQDPAK